MPLLEVKDLVKEFPVKGSKSLVVHAVSGVTFGIEPGETLALVGESGSGKTTTGRCVLRLEEPTKGELWFGGSEFTELNQSAFRRVRPQIQWVSQNPYDALDGRQRIGDAIAEPLRLVFRLKGRELTDRVRKLARLVGLPTSVLDQYPHEMGGGYQQRAVIARSFATEPRLVVLDEPTSALDTLARADIIELLTRLQQQTGVSYLFISHDLITVRSISHRIAVMYLGKIVEIGKTAQVFTAPRHPYTRALLASVLFAEPSASLPTFTLEGEIPSPINLPTGCSLASRCPLALAVCRKVEPPLVPIDPTHRASCLRINVHGAEYLTEAETEAQAATLTSTGRPATPNGAGSPRA